MQIIEAIFIKNTKYDGSPILNKIVANPKNKKFQKPPSFTVRAFFIPIIILETHGLECIKFFSNNSGGITS